MNTNEQECLACSLSSSPTAVPGGRIVSTGSWCVEHCVGPLGVGTLIVKPFRHCVSVADLTAEESEELGGALQQASACVRELGSADQVYVCLWSHAKWTPAHIHFVIQPVWNRLKKEFAGPGPFLQAEMFRHGEAPPEDEVVAFCDEAREWYRA